MYLYHHLKDTEVYLHTYILGMDVQLYFSDVIFKKTSLPVVLPFFPYSNSIQILYFPIPNLDIYVGTIS